MRNRALLLVCLVSIAVSSLTKAHSRSFLHLNPGELSDLPETVPVNVVFVGYEPSLVSVELSRGIARHLQADCPIPILLRCHGGTRPALYVRVPRDVHQHGVGEQLLQRSFGSGHASTAHAVPGTVQRATQQRSRRGSQSFHRRPLGRKMADRQRARRSRHAPQHDLLHQLVGTFGFQVSRLHEVRGA